MQMTIYLGGEAGVANCTASPQILTDFFPSNPSPAYNFQYQVEYKSCRIWKDAQQLSH